VVEAVGSKVTRFKPGDRVMPIFTQSHLADVMPPDAYGHTLGGPRNGVMRTYATFNEETLVRAPESLDFVQAASLPCAAVTAWNSIFGLESRAVKPGDWVLTQGTGGVSLFALQVSDHRLTAWGLLKAVCESGGCIRRVHDFL
jgi:NADPH:quinone reductase-like Zn-dependent oxidoreductase